jgi:hypothetical protein
MLRFAGSSVLETCEGLGDIAAIVVLVHVHAKVAFSIPVNGTFVVFLKNFCKNVGMLPPNVLDTKVVDTESEQERSPVMFPKAWSDIALLVAMLVELFFEKILCKDARLQETIHTFLYFDLDCTIICSLVIEVVGLTKSRGRLLIFMHMYSS